MATKITKKEKKELDELEDELLFLSSKKKELEEKYASLKKENDSRQDNFVLALKEEYSSSLRSACSRLIEKETQKSIEALGAFEDSEFLKELSMKLAIREC